MLLLHGAMDSKTPPSHSQRIYAALGEGRRLVVLPGVGHDEILGREEAWREIEAFLEELPAALSEGSSQTLTEVGAEASSAFGR